MKQVLEEINNKYISDISAKFIITLGDEFQGLLGNGVNTMNIVSEIGRKMYPVKIRFGIGIGADGPAYYKARDAIEYLKGNEKKNKQLQRISDLK